MKMCKDETYARNLNSYMAYLDPWLSKWKCNLADPKQWVDISLVQFSFPAKSNVMINSIIMIRLIMQPRPNKTLM